MRFDSQLNLLCFYNHRVYKSLEEHTILKVHRICLLLKFYTEMLLN